MVQLTFDLITGGHVVLILAWSYCWGVSLFLPIIKLNTTRGMLAASNSLCAVQSVSHWRRYLQQGTQQPLLRLLFSPNATLSSYPTPNPPLALPAIYNHSCLHGPKQGICISPSSLFLISSYLIKLFPCPLHCLYPFPIHHLCFSLTLENLCFQSYKLPSI